MVDRSNRHDAAHLVATVADNIRSLRARRGLSLSELASRSGLGKSTLSLLESGKGNPSVETLWAIAVALDVPFATLIERPNPSARVVRAGEGIRLASEDATLVSRLMLSSPRRGSFEFYVVDNVPERERQSATHTRGTVEHVFLLAGRMRLVTADTEVELEVGDLASFPGDAPHSYQALEPDTRMMLILDYV